MERKEGSLSLIPALTCRSLGPTSSFSLLGTSLCWMLWGPITHSVYEKRLSAWLGFLQELPPHSENGAEKVSGSHQLRS